MSNLSFVTISKPCNERVAAMQPNERGHFCQQCSKTVVDLTHLSREELVAYKAANPGPMCAAISGDAVGLHHASHSNAWMRQLRRFFLACLVVFGSSLFVLPSKAFAQELEVLKEMCAPIDYEKKGTSYHFYGQLLDEDTGEGIENATITIPGTRAHTKTDAEGNFELVLITSHEAQPPEQLDLLAESAGYEPEVIPGPKYSISKWKRRKAIRKQQKRWMRQRRRLVLGYF